jgi:hypothetical protein
MITSPFASSSNSLWIVGKVSTILLLLEITPFLRGTLKSALSSTLWFLINLEMDSILALRESIVQQSFYNFDLGILKILIISTNTLTGREW